MIPFDIQNRLLSEFRFQTSRSGGSGGQNVNKVETRVELLFNVFQSEVLSDYRKELIRKNLAGRIDAAGILHITCQEFRSQFRNKTEVIEKTFYLLDKAITEQKPRKATKPGKAAQEKRLAIKKINSAKKKERRIGGTLD